MMSNRATLYGKYVRKCPRLSGILQHGLTNP
jgi:hypothetical protein